MRSLHYYIRDAFSGRVYSRGSYVRNHITDGTKKYLEIPLNENVIEIPIFFINDFKFLINNKKDNIDKIVIELSHIGAEPSYKTLSRYMQDLIRTSYKDKLVKCQIKKGGEYYNYYVTGGFITDSEFNPILIAGWQLSREWAENKYMYKFIKPFFKISPTVLEQKDSMQNFIVKKIIPNLFVETLDRPSFPNTDSYINNYSINVEIGKECIPIAKVVDKPSISLSNDALIQLAINTINNINVI